MYCQLFTLIQDIVDQKVNQKLAFTKLALLVDKRELRQNDYGFCVTGCPVTLS